MSYTRSGFLTLSRKRGITQTLGFPQMRYDLACGSCHYFRILLLKSCDQIFSTYN